MNLKHKKIQILKNMLEEGPSALVDPVLDLQDEVQAIKEKDWTGPPGIPGKDGNTPVKNVDYFDGAKGDPGESIVGPRGPRGLSGKDGKDGESIIGPSGKDGSPDSPTEVRDKLISLEDDDRLPASAIKGLPELTPDELLAKLIKIPIDKRQQFVPFPSKIKDNNKMLADGLWMHGGGGSSLLLQTNSVDNGSQSLLNLIQGTNMTITDDGMGGITFDAAAGTPSLTEHQIAFGDAANLMTSSADFVYNTTSSLFNVAFGGNTALRIDAGNGSYGFGDLGFVGNGQFLALDDGLMLLNVVADNGAQFSGNVTSAGIFQTGNNSGGGTPGEIVFIGSTSGQVSIKTPAAPTSWSLTLPTTDGNANQFLQTDGSGVTTWASAITTEFISSVSDTNTIDLTVAAGNLSADLRYVDSATINFSDSGAGFTGITIQQMSITSDASGLKLVNDATTPGNSKYYGTDGTGTKGFFSLPTGTVSGTGTDNHIVRWDGTGVPVIQDSDPLIDDTGHIQGVDGAVGTPAFTFKNDTDGGMWRPGANTIALSAGGVETIRSSDTAVTINNPGSATVDFFVAGDTDTGLIQTNATNDAVYIGGGEGVAIATTGQKFAVLSGASYAKNMALFNRVVTNPTVTTGNDLLLFTTVNKTDGLSLSLIKDHFLSLIQYTATNASSVLNVSAIAADHIKADFNASSSGTITRTNWTAHKYSRDDTHSGTFTDEWEVNLEGTTRNRYNGRATITLSAVAGTPDSAVITFPYTLPDTNYTPIVKGFWADAYTLPGPVKVYHIYCSAEVRDITLATTGFTAFLNYTAYSIVTGNWVGSWHSQKAMNTALGITVNFAIDTTPIYWLIRRFY